MLGFKEEEYGDGGVVEGYSKQQWDSNKTMEVERWEKRLVYIQEAKDPNITTLPDAIHRALRWSSRKQVRRMDGAARRATIRYFGGIFGGKR